MAEQAERVAGTQDKRNRPPHRRFAAAVVTAVSTVLLAGCSPTPPPTTEPSTSTQSPSPTPTVHPVTAADLGATWRPECPVGPDQLRRVDVDFFGDDGQTHRGELVVNKTLVPQVVSIFQRLHELRYPIAKMRTVEHYPNADDELSMKDNNTSAFNCRPLGSGWSQHAYGRAIDINPLVNPYLSGSGDLQPKTAAPYLDRSRTDPGLLHDGDPAVRAFTDAGWHWGGHWHSPVDYQHFERP